MIKWFRKRKKVVEDKGTFHSSCDTLPYGRFMEAVVSRSPVFLIITGNPNSKELEDAWDLIKAEFNDKIKTPKSKSLFHLWKKINSIQSRIQLIAIIIHTLRFKGYDLEIAEELQALGYDLIKADGSKEKYMKDIKLVETAAKFLEFQLHTYITEYNLMAPPEDAVSQTIDDYNKELAVIQKYMGFRLDKEVITTSEYCSYFNLFIDSQKQ